MIDLENYFVRIGIAHIFIYGIVSSGQSAKHLEETSVIVVFAELHSDRK